MSTVSAPRPNCEWGTIPGSVAMVAEPCPREATEYRERLTGEGFVLCKVHAELLDAARRRRGGRGLR